MGAEWKLSTFGRVYRRHRCILRLSIPWPRSLNLENFNKIFTKNDKLFFGFNFFCDFLKNMRIFLCSWGIWESLTITNPLTHNEQTNIIVPKNSTKSKIFFIYFLWQFHPNLCSTNKLGIFNAPGASRDRPVYILLTSPQKLLKNLLKKKWKLILNSAAAGMFTFPGMM